MPDLRSQMIRMASALPQGDPTRKKLLAAVQRKEAGVQKGFKPLVKIKVIQISPAGEGLLVKGTLSVESGLLGVPTPFVITVEYRYIMGTFVITDVVKPNHYTPFFTDMLNAALQEDAIMGALGDVLEAAG